MDVDRVKGDSKGKGKKGDKGKGKGKDNWWNTSWAFGRGRGNGKGRGKGKGKGKNGKGRGKGKGKGKKGGKFKGGGKPRVAENQCTLCYEFGHWSRECPNRMVNQVENNTNYLGGRVQNPPNPPQMPQNQQPSSLPQPPQSSQASQSSTQYRPPSSQYAPSTNSTVRRIFNLGSMEEVPSSSSSYGVRVILEDIPEEVVQVTSEGSHGFDEDWIILDSGSDVSLLPSRFQPDSKNTKGYDLRDCQGGALKTTGTKSAELLVVDAEGNEVILKHNFITADVKTGIVSLGRLYKQGWSVLPDESGPMLVSPCSNLRVPVCYRNSSLAIRAHVRCVDLVENQDDDPNILYTMAIVSVDQDVEEVSFNSWQMTSSGHPIFKSKGRQFLDPRPVWGEFWHYRSTLIRDGDSENPLWKLVELSEIYTRKEDPFCVIPEIRTEIGKETCEILTVLGNRPYTISEIGVIVEEGDLCEIPEMPPPRDILADPVVPEEPNLQEPIVGPAEPAEPARGPEAAPAVAPQEELADDVICVTDGLTVSRHSHIKDLREACRWLGKSQSGSKERMFRRIKEAHLEAIRREAVILSQEQYRASNREPNSVPVPRQPSDRERSLHSLTHEPFQPWCKFCVMCRSKSDPMKSSKPEENAERTKPCIQVDYFYGEGGGHGADSKPMLLMVDSWTRFVHVEVLKSKTSRATGEAISRFVGMLSYVEPIDIAGDNEPSLVTGLEMCKQIRATMGLQTNILLNPNYSKQRTAIAERMVQTIRNLGKTLVAQVEDSIGCTLEGTHPLIYWAMSHASWIYNRFHVHATMKVTPYQVLHGRPYRGKITLFGQVVFGLDPLIKKYRPAWRKGIWLGKDGANQDIVATSDSEITRSKAIRVTNLSCNAKDIVNLKINPWETTGYTHSRVKVSALPPIEPVMPQESPDEFTEDEAASDPPSPDGAEILSKDDLEEPRASLARESEQGGGTENMEVSQSEPASGSQPKVPRVAFSVRPEGEMSMRSKPVHEASEGEIGNVPKQQRVDPDSVIAPKVKAAKTDHTVRHVCQVEVCHNDEIPLEEQIGFDFDELDENEQSFLSWEEQEELGKAEGEGPPKVSDEVMKELDAEAAIEELKKLQDMGVIEPTFVDSSSDVEASFVDMTMVYDWRFRDSKWKRRCRIVAREFKTNNTNEEQFAPTSSFASVRMLLSLSVLHGLGLMVLDIKDAFLLVPQVETMFILIPRWIQNLDGNDPHNNAWKLHRTLPGQRNAALRWNEFFTEICKGCGLIPYLGSPTIFKHNERKMYLTVHVDDIMVVSSQNDAEWFLDQIKMLTLKRDGPHEQGSHQKVFYLKKQITLMNDGILIQPSATYIPKLTALLKVNSRRSKGLPYHATLESYVPELENPEDRLSPEDCALFRSGLGLVLYVAQDRPDIQFAVKVLSTYMTSPNVKSMSALKHLALYLDRTRNDGIKMRKAELYETVFDHWKGFENHESRKDRSMYNLEAFSDASWGDDKSSRKSTSSGVLFLNGMLVCSLCRTQATVALSSCESELYAANSTMSESLYLYQLLKWLVSDPCEVNSDIVRQKLYVDSSSAQSFIQRAGLGRMKHISVRMMYLQQLLRKHCFQLCRIPTKFNPSDLNTKRLSKERRLFLGKLIGLHQEEEDSMEPDYDSLRVNQIRALMSVASCMGFSISLKGCAAMTGNGMSNEELSTVWLSLQVLYAYVVEIFAEFFNYVALKLGQLTLLLLVACFVCWMRYGSEGIDTLFGRSFVLQGEVMKCLFAPVYEKVIKVKLEIWRWKKQRAISRRDRPGAREACDRLTWWHQEKRILDGIVYGFFDSDVRYMEDYPIDTGDGLVSESEEEEPNDTNQGIWNDPGIVQPRSPPTTTSEPGGEPLPEEDGGDSNALLEYQSAVQSAMNTANRMLMRAEEENDVEAIIHYENQLNMFTMM